MSIPLLSIDRLTKVYPKGNITALDNVTLSLHKQKTLGIVGESGSGKTTLGKAIMGIITPTSGTISYRGKTKPKEYRGEIQYIFQDPYASMNPLMNIERIIGEPLSLLTTLSRNEKRDRIDEVLLLCGLNPLMKHRYPREFSGGQRQRICIARALASNPRFLICDEPTSSLDVSIQAQIVTLLMGLQEELGLTYLFISHNIALVKYMAHEVAVMQGGRIVEVGTKETLFEHPEHPYTQSLLLDQLR